MTLIYLSWLRNLHYCVTINETPCFIWFSPVFLLKSFFCSRVQSRIPFCLQSHLHWYGGDSDSDSHSVFPCSPWPWPSRGMLATYSVKHSSVCLMFFSWPDWGYRFLERIPWRWSTLLIALYKRVYGHQHDLLSVTFTLLTQWRWGLPGVSIVNFYFFPPVLFFGSMSLHPIPTWEGGRELSSISWRRGYLLGVFGFLLVNRLSIFSHLFIYSIVFLIYFK